MKVAVIIPCFNVETHVGSAVRSALEQTHTDLDIIAVDDGSTDGTREVLESLARSSNGRFRWIGRANLGACSARNAGVSDTQGVYIQFLDADDTLERDKIERQVALARANEYAELVIGGFRNRFENGKDEVVLPLVGQPWAALVRTRMGTTSSNLFKREAVNGVRGWNERQRSSQDYELMFRILAAGGRVAWDNAVASTVLKRASGSISKTDERDNWVRYLDLRRAMRDHMVRIDPQGFKSEIEVADQYLFMAIRVLSKHDPDAAAKEFDRTLDRAFVPDRTKATTAAYIFFYRVFGFRVAERFALAIARSRHRVKAG
ncbi:MAG: glycosyltransferase family A protein [Flavobacteriales bacterium]